MRVYVCVKQVPDTSGKVAVKEDGTLDRGSMETIINPDDLAAMEAALQLKDTTGCQVTAVTMGPPPAEGMLRELIAMGASPYRDPERKRREEVYARERVREFVARRGELITP